MQDSTTTPKAIPMKTEWLTERCDSLDGATVAKRDLELLGLDEAAISTLLADAEQQQRWVLEMWGPFVANLEPSDEVWRFRSPRETWHHDFSGCAGYCVVRDGEIIRSLVTARS